MNPSLNQPRRRWAGEFFSARYFLTRALVLAALFLIAHLAGLREYTTFLSGTTGNPGATLQYSAFWGTVYLVLYFGFVLAIPILTIAAGLLWLWGRIRTQSVPATNPNEQRDRLQPQSSESKLQLASRPSIIAGSK